MTDAVRSEAALPGDSGDRRPTDRRVTDRQVFVLDSESWAALSKILERPVRDVASLRELLSGANVLPS